MRVSDSRYPEGLDHVMTVFGKSIVKIHEVATAVRQTVCLDRVEFFGQIPRKPVSHLHRRFELCGRCAEAMEAAD